MGLMDRDYMHEKGRRRPFGPPPDRFSTLSKVLIFVAVLFLLYKVADWKLNQRARPTQPSSPTSQNEPATAVRPSTQLPAAIPRQAESAYKYVQPTESGTRTVTKCVVNGKTSYGDGACTQGSVVSRVTTRQDHNLMDAVRPQPAARTETTFTQETVVTHSPTVDAKKAECVLIDTQIKNLDAMARQPQSGQTQDWITAERKKLRDRQFRIPCQ